MLSPTIVSALVAMREADLERQSELARRRHVDPAPEAPRSPALPGRRRRTRTARRRRHLRLV